MPLFPIDLKLRSHLKKCIRFICLLGTVFLLVKGSRWQLFVSAASPFVTLATLLATHAFMVSMVVGVAVAFLVILRHRLFCRWICPTGSCMDTVSWLGRRCGRRMRRGYPWGRWLLWLTLGGALLGYPLFIWLDPLSVFSACFLCRSDRGSLAAWAPVLLFLILLVTSVLWPHLWCRRICPLGALQDQLPLLGRKVKKVVVSENGPVPSPQLATHPFTRRALLGLAGGAVGTTVVQWTRAKDLRAIRPPGGDLIGKFNGLCTRCGNCMRSCPSKIIKRDTGHANWAGFMTPILNFDHDYCREDCVRCTQVCPSGAIRPVSLEKKSQTQFGLARVDMSICLLGDDRECSACRRWCPYEAIRYVFSEEDYTLVPIIDSRKCNGCGACQVYCPTKPRKAIVVHAIDI